MSKQRKESCQIRADPTSELLNTDEPTNSSKADDINDLKAKISELTTLVNAFSKGEKKKKKELHCIQMCGSLTLPAPNPCLLVKSDPLSAKPLEISAKSNLGQLMRNSFKICRKQALLTKKLLFLRKASKLSQLLKNRLHKKNISLDILISLLALCVRPIHLLTLKAIHSTSDLTGNHHHNHQWL